MRNELTLRIDYDDDALDIMDKVNAMLKSFGIQFINDEKPHDGFEIYTIEKENTNE